MSVVEGSLEVAWGTLTKLGGKPDSQKSTRGGRRTGGPGSKRGSGQKDFGRGIHMCVIGSKLPHCGPWFTKHDS